MKYSEEEQKHRDKIIANIESMLSEIGETIGGKQEPKLRLVKDEG